MCGKVLFLKKMCARNKHGRISMTKPLEFISNSCSSQIHHWIWVKLKTILLRRCRKFSPNFSIIGLAVRELHLPGVKGVVGEFMEGFP
jgi:hypothetical protein